MPTYTAPTTRATGELISAAIYNTDLVENIKYFKDAPAFAANVSVGGTLGVTGATTLSSATYSTFLKSTTALATPAALTATQATAFASTVSGSAIMGFGTTNDVALMNRAGTVVLGIGPNTTTVNMTGLLSVTGFGTHSFSAGGTGTNQLDIRNTTAGTGNYSSLRLGNDASASLMQMLAFSSTYTSGGEQFAAGVTQYATGSGGLSLVASHASGAIRFYSGGTTLRGMWATDGRFLMGDTTFIDGLFSIAASGAAYNLMALKSTNDTTGNKFMIYEASGGGVIGSISQISNTGVAFNVTSDQRLKTDLGIACDISRLRRLKIHDFEWKSDGTRDRGLFAQEAYSLYPLAITIGTDERNHEGQLLKPWGVDYSKYVPDLIVGWQQHNATISQLAARIAALEGRQ